MATVSEEIGSSLRIPDDEPVELPPGFKPFTEEMLQMFPSIDEIWKDKYAADFWCRSLPGMPSSLNITEGKLVRALILKEKTLGLGDSSTIDTILSLSTVYQMRNRSEEAIAVLERTVSILTSRLQAEQPWMPDIYSMLGNIFEKQGNTVEAEKNYEQELSTSESLWGSRHRSTVSCLSKLGMVYASHNKIDRARSIAQRFPDVHESDMDLHEPSEILSCEQRAFTYAVLGKLEHAEAMFLQVLNGIVKTGGWAHPHIGATIQCLCKIYRGEQNLDKEAGLLQRALEGSKAEFGPDHDLTLRFANMVGTIYVSQGEIYKAARVLLPREDDRN